MEEGLGTTFMQEPRFGKSVGSKMDPAKAEPENVADDDRAATDDLEFAFSSVESEPGGLLGAPADEIFSNGRILPVYPVFNQDLVAGVWEKSGEEGLAEGLGRLDLSLEKRDLRSGSVSSTSTMSSEGNDQEDLRSSEAEYCIWTPRSAPQSPDRWQKSRSTGSRDSQDPEFRRFRLRDLIVGRSQSDGKKKLMFLPEPEKEIKKAATEAEKKGKSLKEKGKAGAVRELDVATAHRIHYGKKATGGRRNFLPYRQDQLIGFFGYRERHPF